MNLELTEMDYYVKVDDWKMQSTLTTTGRGDWITKLIV